MALVKPQVGRVDYARLDATTEDDIRRQSTQDDDDLGGDTPFVEPPESIRRRLAMSQSQFAKALRIPIATLRNWEQKRTRPDPAALALLHVLAREPEMTLKALAA